VYAYRTITVEVPVETVAPVMERIAKCESGNTHYRNGQVIFNANKGGSVDIGLYQINSIWNKKATEMKLDLTKPVQNDRHGAQRRVGASKNVSYETFWAHKNTTQRKAKADLPWCFLEVCIPLYLVAYLNIWLII